jgi:hypothetical protein
MYVHLSVAPRSIDRRIGPSSQFTLSSFSAAYLRVILYHFTWLPSSYIRLPSIISQSEGYVQHMSNTYTYSCTPSLGFFSENAWLSSPAETSLIRHSKMRALMIIEVDI